MPKGIKGSGPKKIVPSAEKKPSGITDAMIMQIRLKCLLAVVEGGSAMDARSPVEKAQAYFDWIMKVEPMKIEKIENTKENKKEVEAISKPQEPSKETVKEIPANNPFSDTGRKQVML